MNMEPFKIFFSYPREHEIAAREIKDILEIVGAGRLYFATSNGYTSRSTGQIKELIYRAEMLLFIIASKTKSDSYDTTLYEIGLFESYNKKRPIVALSSIGLEIPRFMYEIANIVKANLKEIKKFLELLFLTTEITKRDAPILDLRNEYILEEIAYKITSVVPPTPIQPDTRYHANSLTIRFKKPITGPEIPDNVEVEADAFTLRMLGLLEGNRLLWGNIRTSSIGDMTWMAETGKAIHSIVNNRLPEPIKTPLQSIEGKSFIPIIYRDDKYEESGLRIFHLLFVPSKIVPIDPKLVFAITRFSDDMAPVYEAIEEAAAKYGLVAQRVKDVVGDYRITDKILYMVQKAKFIVADLTHERPNVYFELGYARGLEKRVVTILRKGTNVHFDVKDWTYIEYDDSRNLERSLIDRFKIETEPDRKLTV